MSMTDDAGSELVTNVKMLAPASKLRFEEVVLPDEYTTSGQHPKLLQWELNGRDYNRYQDSLRVYDGGFQVGVDIADDDLKFLAETTRDHHGNRLWEDPGDAVAFLGQYGRSSLALLLAAAQRVNGARPTVKQQKAAEENLGAAPSGSSNGTSPSTSGASTPASSPTDSSPAASTWSS